MEEDQPRVNHRRVDQAVDTKSHQGRDRMSVLLAMFDEESQPSRSATPLRSTTSPCYVARALKDPGGRLTAACLSGQAPIVRWGEETRWFVQRLKARPAICAFESGLVVTGLTITEGQRDQSPALAAAQGGSTGRADCHQAKRMAGQVQAGGAPAGGRATWRPAVPDYPSQEADSGRHRGGPTRTARVGRGLQGQINRSPVYMRRGWLGGYRAWSCSPSPTRLPRGSRVFLDLWHGEARDVASELVRTPSRPSFRITAPIRAGSRLAQKELDATKESCSAASS